MLSLYVISGARHVSQYIGQRLLKQRRRQGLNAEALSFTSLVVIGSYSQEVKQQAQHLDGTCRVSGFLR